MGTSESRAVGAADSSPVSADPFADCDSADDDAGSDQVNGTGAGAPVTARDAGDPAPNGVATPVVSDGVVPGVAPDSAAAPVASDGVVPDSAAAPVDSDAPEGGGASASDAERPECLTPLPRIMFEFLRYKGQMDARDPTRADKRSEEVEALMESLRLIGACTSPGGYPAEWSTPMAPCPVTTGEVAGLVRIAANERADSRNLDILSKAFNLLMTEGEGYLGATNYINSTVSDPDFRFNATSVLTHMVGGGVHDPARVCVVLNAIGVEFTPPHAYAKCLNASPDDHSLPSICLGTYHRPASPGEIIISCDWAERVRREKTKVALRRLIQFTNPETRPFMHRVRDAFGPGAYEVLTEHVRIACTIRAVSLARAGLDTRDIPAHAWDAVFFGNWPF